MCGGIVGSATCSPIDESCRPCGSVVESATSSPMDGHMGCVVGLATASKSFIIVTVLSSLGSVSRFFVSVWNVSMALRHD